MYMHIYFERRDGGVEKQKAVTPFLFSLFFPATLVIKLSKKNFI